MEKPKSRRAAASGASESEVADLRAAWQATLPPAEQSIAQSLTALAVREGLTTSVAGGDRLLPPPSFLITDPPRVLVVSPRDRVEVAQAERDLLAWIGARFGELAEAPVAFESDHVTVAGLESLSADGVDLRPTTGVVVALRAVKDDAELATQIPISFAKHTLTA